MDYRYFRAFSNPGDSGFTDASLNYLVSFDAPWQVKGSNVLKDLNNIDICSTGGSKLTDKFEFAGVVTDICASAFENMSLSGELDFSNFFALKTIGKDAFRDNSFTSLELSGNPSLTTIEPFSFIGNSFSQGVTFTNCPSLQIIGKDSFQQSKISGELDFSGLESLTDICNGAFSLII